MFDDIKPKQSPIPTPDTGEQDQLISDQPTNSSPKAPPADIPTATTNVRQKSTEQSATVQKPQQEPEDIFADVDEVAAKNDYSNQPPNLSLPSSLNGGNSDNMEMPGLADSDDDSAKGKGRGKKIIIIVLVIVVAIGAAGVIYSYFIAPSRTSDKITPLNSEKIPQANNNVNTNTNSTNANANININIPIVNADTDGDGLTDDQEAMFGTDPKLVDTDQDGLTDQQEIMTYSTDPNNNDTDGDSYLDGAEVKSGYNPLGEGKLDTIELP